jgi:hypothetical protein
MDLGIYLILATFKGTPIALSAGPWMASLNLPHPTGMTSDDPDPISRLQASLQKVILIIIYSLIIPQV